MDTFPLKKIEQLLNTPRRLVFFHRDTDGTTSAAQLLRFYPSTAWSLEYNEITPELVERVRPEKPGVIIFLDISIDQYWGRLKELEKIAPILIIDHHIIHTDLNSDRILHINPRFTIPDAYEPASYLIYHLLKAMGKSPPVWLAGMGVIGDYAFEQCTDVLIEVKKKDGRLVKGDPRRSLLGVGSDIITAATIVKKQKGADTCLDVLLRSDEYDNFAKNEQLQTWYRIVRKEIDHAIELFSLHKDHYPEKRVYFLEVQSPYSIISEVATLLSEQHPQDTIIVYRATEGGWKLSARNQSGRVNLNNLIRSCIASIGSGGGHEKAAGGFTTNWDEFKKNVLSTL